MSKKKFGFVTSIILGAIFVIFAIIRIIEDSNQNLTNCAIVIGKVVSKDIIRIKRYKYKKNHFSFKLNNSNQNFTVFRNHEGYSDLEAAIQIGDTVKVYIIPNTSTVFQVEKNNIVLESFKEYKKETGTMPVLILAAGIFVILYSILSYYNLNLGVLLNRIIDPNYGENIS